VGRHSSNSALDQDYGIHSHHKAKYLDDIKTMTSHNPYTQNCSTCKLKKWAPVCGEDGHTYASHCHATHCGRLLPRHVSPGDCWSKVKCWQGLMEN